MNHQGHNMQKVTCWHDQEARDKALESLTEVYYYMIYSTTSEERKRWADEYTKMIECDGQKCKA